MAANCYVGTTTGSPLLPLYQGDPAQGMCAPGFYCPNSDPNDPATFPRYCPATPECTQLRQAHKYCGPQGPYEPIPCPAGYFCPTGYEQYVCPSGYWCPLGSTEPHKCNAFMHCPEGQVDPPRDYSCLLATFSFDILIVVLVYLLHKRRVMWWGLVDDIFVKQTSREEMEAKEETRRLEEEHIARFEDSHSIRRNSSQMIDQSDRKALVGGGDGEDDVLRADSIILDPAAASAIAKSNRNAVRESPAYAILERGIRANRGKMMPIHIEFDQLSVVVPFKGTGKQLLRGITGAIVPGHVTAIMGPSGAGKTVFMTSLLNKVESNWKLTGKLTINGQEGETLSSYQHMTGYVPQDDIMHPELTVMENIWFSAEARLPRAWSAEDRLRYVAAVIKATGLEEVKHVIVGDGSEPNGVNRKRVCLAIELAAAPSALFLDEPTTGLDAATALDLCTLLKDIAVRSQLTIAMVIHQPRVEIWDSLDELLLIAPGGRTVYQGPQAGAHDYFERVLGLTYDSGNPADIILDGITANQEKCEKAWEEFIASNPDRFADSHNAADNNAAGGDVEMTEVRGTHGEEAPPVVTSPGEGDAPYLNVHSKANHPILQEFLSDQPMYGPAESTEATAPRGGHATPLRQFILVHYRSILKQTARIANILLGIVLSMASAAVMGVAGLEQTNVGMLIAPYSLMNPRNTIYLIPMMMMFYLIAISCSCSASSIVALGEDRQQYWKEAATGRCNKLAYFLAMTSAEIYRLLLTISHFSLIAYFMFNPLIQYWWFFFILLLAFFANDSQGAMLGLIISPKHAPLLTTVAGVFVSLLNGFPNVPGICYAGYTFYVTEAALNRYVMWQRPAQSDAVYDTKYFRYKTDRLALDIIIPILFIVVYRVAAFLIMVFTNRNKQR